ncbi:MAG: GH3 auxin-responsive promoter family protein [Myxococcaceae bacterium]|nr:GH3 auxin-responsive promoter family protein [Myxococcaceae bacterium]
MAPPRLVLLHALGQLARARAAFELELAGRDVKRAQEAKLRALLSAHRDTEYGRAHGFAKLRTPQDYSAAVPLLTPEGLAPYVDRLMAGERNLLSAEAPIYYVRTSGSSGEPKHVPITPSYRTELQKTVQASLWHLFFRFPQAFRGQALYFVGSRRVDVARDGNDVGTMSGFNFTEMPKAVQQLYAWPYALFEVQHLETRTFLALALAIRAHLTVIAGIFPASLVYLLRDFERFAPDLEATFRSGTLPGWLELPAAQQALFAARLERSPAHAELVRRARDHGPDGQGQVLFPHLRLVYCWTAATAALFLPELTRRLGPQVPVRDAIYSACEGWCSVPTGDEEPGGALAITSHFFEFLDEEAYERGERTTRYAWELEDGRRYLIVFSTGAGLHRYLLHDVVETCGQFQGIPNIRFVRKHGAATNLAGEKLVEAHVTQAVQQALTSLKLESAYFVAVPRFDGQLPGYALHVEPSTDWSGETRAAFAAEADRALSGLSFDYGRLRKANALRGLAPVWLPPGRYAAFRQRRVLEGAAEAQLKVSNLVPALEKLPPELRG